MCQPQGEQGKVRDGRSSFNLGACSLDGSREASKDGQLGLHQEALPQTPLRRSGACESLEGRVLGLVIFTFLSLRISLE